MSKPDPAEFIANFRRMLNDDRYHKIPVIHGNGLEACTMIEQLTTENEDLRYERDVMEVAYKSCFNEGQAKRIGELEAALEISKYESIRYNELKFCSNCGERLAKGLQHHCQPT